MATRIIPKVDPEKCDGCGLCVDYCLKDALVMEKGKALLRVDRCDFDRICVPVCPTGAISFEEKPGE